MNGDYCANAGQTRLPAGENLAVEQMPFVPLSAPMRVLPELVLTEDFRERGFQTGAVCRHFLPGVTPEMLDWWWANMEKGYYLWAPGSHKRFNWVRTPWEYGFLHSAHRISETFAPGEPVFGGEGVQISRLELSWYPFTRALEHGIVEGILCQSGELFDMTVHLWQAAPGGCDHMTTSVANTRCRDLPDFLKGSPPAPPKEEDAALRAAHAEYEASRWPVFLPPLYALWKDHPDPSQSVRCDLRMRQTAGGAWCYLAENGPV